MLYILSVKVCEFRSSIHRELIDHFHEMHDRTGKILEFMETFGSVQLCKIHSNLGNTNLKKNYSRRHIFQYNEADFFLFQTKLTEWIHINMEAKRSC